MVLRAFYLLWLQMKTIRARPCLRRAPSDVQLFPTLRPGDPGTTSQSGLMRKWERVKILLCEEEPILC